MKLFFGLKKRTYVDWPDLVLLPLGSTTMDGVETDL
jgi:hypothetical protein